MAVVTVRNLPEETHRALRVRAARHGRSTEAEIREILECAVRPAARVRIGRELAAADAQIAAIATVHGFRVATRDTAPFAAAGVPMLNPWEDSSTPSRIDAQ